MLLLVCDDSKDTWDMPFKTHWSETFGREGKGGKEVESVFTNWGLWSVRFGVFGLEDLCAEPDGCLWPNGKGLQSAIQSSLP